MDKCSDDNGTFTRHRGVAAAEPSAVVVLEPGPIVTPLHHTQFESRIAMSEGVNDS